MVALFVNGVKVGTMEDAATLLPRFIAERQTVQFRDETEGWTLSELKPAPLHPLDPNITKDDWDRIAAEHGGMKLSDFWKKMGVVCDTQ